MKWVLNKLFRHKATTFDEISNDALELSLAWGQDWLQPIQERLLKKFTFLSNSELNEYNNQSQLVLKVGFNFIYATLEEVIDNGKTISESDLKSEFENYITERFTWINKTNLKMMFSQGLYYTWKEGLNSCLR